MSEKIDWSKAPDSAMVLLKHTRDGAYAVAESFSDDARTWHFPETNYTFRLMPSMWYVVSRRPTTPSWSGEGLPPVGVVCMANGYQVVIVAHHCNGIHAIYAESEVDGLLYYGEPNEFRPIRTPEQIAADERESAIRAIVYDLQDAENLSSLPSIANCLYGKGYRKP